MTSYGTIPTSSSPGPSTNLEYLSRAKERIKEGLGARRPWKLMFNIGSINIPGSLSEAISRVTTNVAYFRMNYAMIILVILFLSLLWHPISLIVFIVMMAAWLFLYFLRDEPLVVFNRTIDDRVVLVVLGVLTIVFLLLTDATLNILVSLLIGVAVVLVHASFRKTDDLYDEESAGLMSGPSSSS
ncbi:PRA1 family protein F2-like [Durio zibethinus]|uniref:PRA1 family protein n=1 Tax=Durio zibethinus TaxID=66656 RepID=A0A6P5WGT8_DURZI|nr:PRA1 family protein F2-like [Durio zibethinus]